MTAKSAFDRGIAVALAIRSDVFVRPMSLNRDFCGARRKGAGRGGGGHGLLVRLGRALAFPQ